MNELCQNEIDHGCKQKQKKKHSRRLVIKIQGEKRYENDFGLIGLRQAGIDAHESREQKKKDPAAENQWFFRIISQLLPEFMDVDRKHNRYSLS
jgi:hypothetical protein